ncbi:MAG: VOC family protein [Micropruina glycogenica]
MPTSRPTLDALNIDAVPPGGDYDAEVERLLGLGARKIEHDWGKLNWTVMLDPGNNEFCLLKPTN